MYVFDATPLIYLGTVERLALLADLPDECCTPRAVYDEVVTRGIEAGYPDARRVERAVENDLLSVVSVAETPTYERLRRYEELSPADVAVLALADERRGSAVVDERYGRTVADVEGIETRGTAYLVLLLLRDGVISADAARATIDELVDAGWYCAPDLYAKILRRIETLADRRAERGSERGAGER